MYLHSLAPFAYPGLNLHTRVYLHACIFGSCELDLRPVIKCTIFAPHYKVPHNNLVFNIPVTCQYNNDYSNI